MCTCFSPWVGSAPRSLDAGDGRSPRRVPGLASWTRGPWSWRCPSSPWRVVVSPRPAGGPARRLWRPSSARALLLVLLCSQRVALSRRCCGCGHRTRVWRARPGCCQPRRVPDARPWRVHVEAPRYALVRPAVPQSARRSASLLEQPEGPSGCLSVSARGLRREPHRDAHRAGLLRLCLWPVPASPAAPPAASQGCWPGALSTLGALPGGH